MGLPLYVHVVFIHRGLIRFSTSSYSPLNKSKLLVEFHSKNHTVTQSSFAEPCTRQRNTATNDLDVDSGFQSVPLDAKEVPVWTIEVRQDTSPIWMFCNQGK
jgi:hypothetical protein